MFKQQCRVAAPRGILALALALLLALCAFSPGLAAAPPVKNVIMLIPDGCGSEQYTLARWVKGAPLAFDSILVGGVRTFIADSVVADSAPAATAYASGLRTADKRLGVGPQAEGLLPGQPPPGEMALRPLATVLEAARLKGKSTGLVVTARVSHATPAAFAAHVYGRDDETAIAKQMAHQGLDVLMGGGRRQFLPAAAGGAREDGLDLLARFVQRGYQTPRTRQELAAVDTARGRRVLGLFADDHMRADLDRPALSPNEPTLAEMTAKALEVLAKNPKGFFLMVEGSQVDWACHANDPAHLVGDMLAYDRAVQVALDFARRDGATLLIAMSDHNTGGMSIGNYSTNKSYSQTKLPSLVEPLAKMRLTAKPLWDKLEGQVSPERLKEAVGQWWGMEIDEEEAERIIALAEQQYKKEPHYALGEILSVSHTKVGWTTHGHAGGDVPLFAFGPGRPAGLLEAPEVGLSVARALGADLRALDRRLYAEAGTALAEATLTEHNSPGGWRLKVEQAGRVAWLEDASNLMRLGEREIELEAPVVRVAPTGRWYLADQAVRQIIAGPAPAKPKRAPGAGPRG
jgi:alkaline phosphatase